MVRTASPLSVLFLRQFRREEAATSRQAGRSEVEISFTSSMLAGENRLAPVGLAPEDMTALSTDAILCSRFRIKGQKRHINFST